MEGEGDCLSTAQLSVAYNDLSDVWGDLKDDLDAVLPLDQVLLKNKVGNSTRVKHVPVRVLSASSRAMQALEQHRKSSLAWFRLPFAELVCFSCDDYDEYKRNFRLQLRAMVDQETRLSTDPIPIFVYVQPKTVQDPKGPMRVMDAATKELSDRTSSFRSVIHIVPGNTSGRAELAASLKEALFLSIEARRTAYHNEASRIILRLIRDITSPVKSDITFSDLYLVKDSSAAMLEAAGLYPDAVTEYTEMEAMIEETFARVLSENPTEDKDAYAYLVCSDTNLPEASQLWQNWFVNRSIVSTAPRGVKPATKEGRAFIDLVILPAIKANVIRNLVKDMKIVAALETFVQFVEGQRDLLGRFEDVKRCPSNIASAWTFSACIGMSMLICSSSSVRDCGRIFLSRAMEDVEILSREAEDEMLNLNTATVKALRKEDRDTSAQLLGKILIIARESLKAIGRSNGFGAPEMTASVEELSRQLDRGFDGSPVSTPLQMVQTPSLTKTPTDPIHVTPQNSLGPNDIRLMHFEESAHLTHEHTISMDNIDLSSQLADLSVSDLPVEETNRPIQSEISLHTRDISDSESGASLSPRVRHDSDKVPFQQSQPGPGDARPNLSLSLLRLEKEIQKVKKLSCLYISTDESAQLQETSWKPQYWRLQRCLSSSHAFQNMWKAITAACKTFFDICGWERNSRLLEVELADIAYLEGDVGAAMEIYTFIVADLLNLKWHTLFVSILQRLALCQVKEKSTAVIWTCCLLMKACRELSLTAQELQKYSEMFVSSTSLGEPVLPEPWIVHLSSNSMTMNPLLSIRGCSGVFVYDLSSRKASDGCIKAHVGDSVEIAVRCKNNLGISFSLEKVRICLTRLQEMSEISDMGRSIASPSYDTPVPLGHASPLVSPTSPYNDSWRPNVVSHWRDIDEIEGECTDASPVQVKTDETTIHFLVNPIKSGLYKLSSICGFMNEAFVEIQSEDLERHDGQTIMLKVDPPVPRMHVKAATLGNPSLISGEDQWLGIEIELERDSVSHATVNIDWPSRNIGNKGPEIAVQESDGTADALPSQFLFYPKLHSVLVQNLSGIDEKRVIAPETGDDILSTTGPASLYAVDFDSDCVHALLWWRVSVGHLEVPIDDVRISSNRVRKENSSANLHQGIESKRTLSTIGLPVSLLYSDQCSRVASASAKITIDQPFQIQTEAREMDKGVFLVSLKITSATEREVQIDSVEIDCQKGFSMSKNLLQESGSLPLVLDPLGACHASFILHLDASLLDNRAVAQAMVYRTGKLLPSAARIAYSPTTLGETDTNIAMASHSPREQRVENSFATMYSVFDQTMGPTEKDMDLMMQQEAAAHHHSHDTSTTCNHIHRFALQLSSIDTDSYNVFVSVRMLGPFSATIGCPVTLCWQLERVGTCERKALSQISYEIHFDSHTWSSTSKDQGRVLLGLKHGSIATIEAQWTPTSLGTLEVPLLRLHDVYYEEVRETGVKKNYVIVRS